MNRLARRHPSSKTLERALALTLWGYLFLLIVTLVIGRSVGSALFLYGFDGRGLALVYILVGVVVATLVAGLERLGSGYSIGRVAFCTLAVVFLMMLGAGYFLPRLPAGNHGLLYGGLYLFIESFAFVTTLQFWSMTNSALSMEQARRLYGFVGTGGIFGSIAGGLLTRVLALGTIEHGMLVMAGLVPLQLLALVVMSILVRQLHRRQPKLVDHWNFDHPASSVGLGRQGRIHYDLESSAEPPPPPDSATAGRPLALQLGLVSLLMVFSTTLVDFYYKIHADRSYSGDVQALTSFFGTFYLAVGLATLLTQTVLTPLILRYRSAFLGLFVSPVSLCVMTLTNLLVPGIWSAAAFKLTDSVLSHSIYRSCQEVLYTPLPTRWVPRIKSLSDGVFGRYGLLLAGVLLLLLSPLLDARGPHWLLPCILVALAAWAIAIASLRRQYPQDLGMPRRDRPVVGRTSPIHGQRAAVESDR